MCHQVYAHLPTASVGSLIKSECWIQKQTAEWLSGTIFSSITSPQWMNVKFVQESSWSISHCMFTGTAFHLYVLHFFFVAWYSQACKESLDLGWLKGSMNSNHKFQTERGNVGHIQMVRRFALDIMGSEKNCEAPVNFTTRKHKEHNILICIKCQKMELTLVYITWVPSLKDL